MDDQTIDRLKQEWTGKHVEIGAGDPAHQRFSGRIGTVVTVNMNGRALIRFEETPDTFWFDLPIGCLRVVESAPGGDDAATTPATEPADTVETPNPPRVTSDRAAPASGARRSTQSILEMARRQDSGGKQAE